MWQVKCTSPWGMVWYLVSAPVQPNGLSWSAGNEPLRFATRGRAWKALRKAYKHKADSHEIVSAESV